MSVHKTVASRVVSVLIAVSAVALTDCSFAEPAHPIATSEPEKPANNVYRLGLGDKLRIDIYGEPQLSGEFQVSGSGVVTMPLVGDVHAVGLTPRELEATLTGRYAAGYLRDPKIAVEIYAFRPYYVLGEVQKPGSYPSVEGMTVLTAVATAGGFTYRANTRKAFLRHAGEAVEHKIELGANAKIEPGDVLRVGERYF